MQDVFEQDGFEWNIRSSKIRRVEKSVVDWCGYNQLCRPVERAEVLIEIVLLLSSLAGGGRPKLYRVRGDAHVDQARRGSDHQRRAGQYDCHRMLDTEGTPAAEERSQDILETFTQRFTACCVSCGEKNTD